MILSSVFVTENMLHDYVTTACKLPDHSILSANLNFSYVSEPNSVCSESKKAEKTQQAKNGKPRGSHNFLKAPKDFMNDDLWHETILKHNSRKLRLALLTNLPNFL